MTDEINKLTLTELEAMLEQLLKATTQIASGNFEHELNLSSLATQATSAKWAKQFNKQFEQIHVRLKDELQDKEILRQNEARYRSLLEVSPDPIIMYDDLGRATYVNPAFEETFGWSVEELLGKQVDFVPPESKEETQVAITKVFAEGKTGFETKRLTKTGQKLEVLVSASLHTDSDGKPIGIEAIFRDISKRKRAEEAVQRRAQREQTIRQITEKMRLASNLEDLVKITATELGQHLSAAHVLVELGVDSTLFTSEASIDSVLSHTKLPKAHN